MTMHPDRRVPIVRVFGEDGEMHDIPLPEIPFPERLAPHIAAATPRNVRSTLWRDAARRALAIFAALAAIGISAATIATVAWLAFAAVMALAGAGR